MKTYTQQSNLKYIIIGLLISISGESNANSFALPLGIASFATYPLSITGGDGINIKLKAWRHTDNAVQSSPLTSNSGAPITVSVITKNESDPCYGFSATVYNVTNSSKNNEPMVIADSSASNNTACQLTVDMAFVLDGDGGGDDHTIPHNNIITQSTSKLDEDQAILVLSTFKSTASKL